MGKHQRNIMLNSLICRSVSKAPSEYVPPVHGAKELLDILQHRQKGKVAVEYFGGDDDDDDDKRMKSGHGYDFIRIKDISKHGVGDRSYYVLLIEHVDVSARSFPVVDTVSFDGRDLTAGESERGSSSCHLVVRLPKEGRYDVGSYRCAIEYSRGLTRRNIEYLLSRQLRRYAKALGFDFTVRESAGGKKPKEKTYKYYPRIDLAADASRSILSASGKKKLSHIIFTKRHEKLEPGEATKVFHEEIYGDVDLKIPGKQAPSDPDEQREWIGRLRKAYELRGYKSKVFFRHLGNSTIGGEVHDEVAGAADLMLCPKEVIETDTEPRRWVNSIQTEIRDKMIELLERDDIWKRSQ